MKTAFLFSGQGAQYAGMGHELASHAIVRETYEEASDVLGYDMAALCFAENERLNETMYTQPAILTTSIAFYRLLKVAGITPDAVAGLSLGEYSALVAAEALDFKEAVALVAKRGRFMTEAAPSGTGKMVAVMNADRPLLEEICTQASTYGIVAPANYNTPQQIVIGGEVAAVDHALEMLKAAGIKRMIPLNVSGPFHTQLLAPAAEQLAKELVQVNFSPMARPLISNTTAQIMPDADVRDLLTRQVMSAVRFDDSIQTLKALGIDTFVEVGPGKTLTGFLKKIDKQLTSAHVEDQASYDETIALLMAGR